LSLGATFLPSLLGVKSDANLHIIDVGCLASANDAPFAV
jgi:hypothetical protein